MSYRLDNRLINRRQLFNNWTCLKKMYILGYAVNKLSVLPGERILVLIQDKEMRLAKECTEFTFIGY